MKPLSIIGLDPGTTSAYVVLSLDGKLIRTHSSKELLLSEIISEVMDVSSPLIVGTDKARVPGFVEEFARKLGLLVVSPYEDTKREDKRATIQEYRQEYGQEYRQEHGQLFLLPHLNEHQEDCLAAALFAFKKYAPRLQKIDRYVREHALERKREEFTRIALKEDLHFTLIKDILTKEKEESTIMRAVIQENRITKKDFLTLYEKWSRMKQEKMQLEVKMGKLHQQLDEAAQHQRVADRKSTNIDQRIDSLFRFKEQRLHLQKQELEQQEGLVRKLHNDVERLHQFIAHVPQFQLVKKLNSLSQNEYDRKKALLRIKDGDVLFLANPAVHSPKVLEELQEHSIIIIAKERIPPLLQHKFAAFSIQDNDLVAENAHFALMEQKVLEEKRKSRDVLQNVIKEYREQRAKQL